MNQGLSLDFLHAVLENLPEATLACDLSGTPCYLNLRAREILTDRYQFQTVDGTPFPESPFDLADAELLVQREGKPAVLVRLRGKALESSEGKKLGTLVTLSELPARSSVSGLRFETIFQQSPYSIQIFSKTGEVILVNLAWQKFWNLSDDVIRNHLLRGYNVLEDQELERKGVLEYIRKGFQGEVVEIPETVYDMVNAENGERTHWIQSVIYPLKDASGEVQELVLIQQDVSERHKAPAEKEKLLKQLKFERTRLEAVLREMPAGVLVAEASSGRISLQNRKLEVVLGQFHLHRRLRPDGSEYTPEEWPLARSLRTGEVINGEEVELNRPDGYTRYVSISSGPIINKDGKIQAAVVVCTDITEKKRFEKAQHFLSEVSSHLQTTLEYEKVLEELVSAAIPFLSDGCIIDVVEDGKLKRVTTRHRFPKTEGLLGELQQNFPPSADSPHPASRVLRSGVPDLQSTVDRNVVLSRTVNKDHADLIERIGIRSHLAVPLIIRGQILGVMSLLITTERRKFDEHDLATAIELSRIGSVALDNARLYQGSQKAIKQRDEFISIASHELKTPITSLMIQMQLASRTITRSPSENLPVEYVKKLTDSSNRQITRLSRLVDDMLDISRIATGKLALDLSEVNFKDLATEVIERFQDQFVALGIDFTAELESFTYPCDHTRMEQVITNLLTNAIKYGEKKPIRVRTFRKGGFAYLVVEDQGPGIAKADQERIFNRFERAISASEVSGLGLGLAITRQIVGEHGGSVRLESEPGAGARFIVELPT